MPILVEQREGGCLVQVDTSTGKIVDHIEIRDGIAAYIAADGQVLESKVVGRQHHFVCAACGERCKAGNLTGYLPDCPKGYPVPEWEEK